MINLAKSPVVKNITANFFKIFVLLVNQVLLIPLYLKYWNIDMYADWIVVTAIVGFFTMSDAGLNNATTNKFSIEFAQNNQGQCKTLIVNNFAIVSGVFVAIILSIVIIEQLIDIRKVLSIKSFSGSEVKFLVLILTFQVFMQMYSTILNAIYNAKHLASKATYIDNLARLGNALAILLGIVFYFPICMIAILGVIPYLICFVYKCFDIRKLWKVSFSITDFSCKSLREIIVPSVSYLSFPIGNALIFQCFTVIVNTFMGSHTLVCFNTTRTMANFVRSMVQAIAHGIKPEFSIAFGFRDKSRLKNLLNKCILLSLILSVGSAIVIELIGKPIYEVWTAGEIEFDRTLVSIFLVVTVVNSMWESSSIAMTATNNFTRLGAVYLVSCIGAAVLAYFLGLWGISIYGIAMALLITDISMAAYSLIHSPKIINEIQ